MQVVRQITFGTILIFISTWNLTICQVEECTILPPIENLDNLSLWIERFDGLRDSLMNESRNHDNQISKAKVLNCLVDILDQGQNQINQFQDVLDPQTWVNTQFAIDFTKVGMCLEVLSREEATLSIESLRKLFLLQRDQKQVVQDLMWLADRSKEHDCTESAALCWGFASVLARDSLYPSSFRTSSYFRCRNEILFYEYAANNMAGLVSSAHRQIEELQQYQELDFALSKDEYEWYTLNARNLLAMAQKWFEQYDLAFQALGPAVIMAASSSYDRINMWEPMLRSNFNQIMDESFMNLHGDDWDGEGLNGSELAFNDEVLNLKKLVDLGLYGSNMHLTSLFNCAAFSYNLGESHRAKCYLDTLSTISQGDWKSSTEEFVRLKCLIEGREIQPKRVEWDQIEQMMLSYLHSYWSGYLMDDEQRVSVRKKIVHKFDDWINQNEEPYSPAILLRALEIRSLEAWSNEKLLEQLRLLKVNVFQNQDFLNDGWHEDDWKLLFEIRKDLSVSVNDETGMHNTMQRGRLNELTKAISQMYFELSAGWWDIDFGIAEIFKSSRETNISESIPQSLLSLEGVHSRLGANEAFVAILELPDPKTRVPHQYCLLIHREREIGLVVDLGDTDTIEKGMELYNTYIASKRNPQIWGAHAHKGLWAKVDEHLSAIDVLYFYSNESYALFNPEALPSPRISDQMLLDEYSVVEVGNMYFQGDFRDYLAKCFRSGPVLANIFAHSPAPGRRYNFESRSLVAMPIPYVEKEAEVVCEMLRLNGLNVADLWVGEKCNKTSVNEVCSPDLLHLAAHGYYLSELGDGADTFFGYNALPIKTATQAGLLLAPENQTDVEDGVMSAAELSSLNLLNTQLAFVNACESGKSKSEIGLPSGIPSALRYSGVDAMITTCWGVDDKKAVQFVEKFYSNALQGTSFHDAQRQAKLHMRKQDLHPYYWASYKMSF